MTPNTRPLASILTRRLVWIAIAVVFVNAIAVAAYYGSDRETLEREVIAREMSRLEAALDGDPPRVDQRARGLFETHPRAYAFALLDRNGGILDAENAGLVPPQATETGVFAQDWVTRLVEPEGPVLVAAHRVSMREDLAALSRTVSQVLACARADAVDKAGYPWHPAATQAAVQAA